MERFSTFRGRVAMRPKYNGRPVKTGLDQLNGTECEFMAIWEIGADESYPGEFALEPTDPAVKSAFWDAGAGICWIASGDVEPVQNE